VDAVGEEPSPLRIEPDEVTGARVRIRFDWHTFGYLVLAVVAALALLALFRNTQTMVTRISVGLIIALALDPLTNNIRQRFGVSRGVAVAIVALFVLGFATLLVVVLGPRAVEEAGQFSEQLPQTIDELETLPLVGGWFRENDVAERVQEWVRDLPTQITDERIEDVASSLVSGVVSVAIVVVVAIALLVDGENMLGRLRLLIPESRQAQANEIGGVMYRTLGRYFGGSLTVALLMGIYVLTVGLLLGVPLVPLAALWAMITDLIPQVGGFLGGAFFVLLAATEGAVPATVAGVAFVLYMNFENHVIQPAIVGKSVDLTPPTTMVAAFVGGAVAGVPGALVATPVVGAAKAIYLEARGMAKPEPEPRLGRVRRTLQRRKG
jgi:putative heme transporter